MKKITLSITAVLQALMSEYMIQNHQIAKFMSQFMSLWVSKICDSPYVVHKLLWRVLRISGSAFHFSIKSGFKEPCGLIKDMKINLVIHRPWVAIFNSLQSTFTGKREN